MALIPFPLSDRLLISYEKLLLISLRLDVASKESAESGCGVAVKGSIEKSSSGDQSPDSLTGKRKPSKRDTHFREFVSILGVDRYLIEKFLNIKGMNQ